MPPTGTTRGPINHRAALVLLAAEFALAVAAFPNSGLLLQVLCLGLIVIGVRELSGRMSVSWPTAAFIVWCALSLTWTASTEWTSRGLIETSLLAISGATAAQVLSLDDLLRSLSVAAKVVLVLSWLAYFLLPTVGRTQDSYHFGALEGIFDQRNSAAFGAVLFFIIFVTKRAVRVVNSRNFRLAEIFWIALAATTVLAAQSGTGLALLGLAAVCCAIPQVFVPLGRKARRSALGLAAVPIALFAWWISSNLTVVSGLFGRDSTLTGRTVIWQVVEGYFPRAPLQGFGWGALWKPGVPITEEMWSRAGFQFFHAHEAYLDLRAQVGVVGLILFSLLLAASFVTQARLLLSDRPQRASFGLAVLITLVIYSLTEQALVSEVGLLLIFLLCHLSAKSTSVEQSLESEPAPGERFDRERSGRIRA